MITFLLKLLYISLFCSMDILLYLRLIKEKIWLNKFLVIVAVAWSILLILHLPFLSIPSLMPLRLFGILSGMIVQLFLAYLFSVFNFRRIDRLQMREDLKEYARKFISIMFQNAVFVFFIIVHFLYILSWPG